MIIHIISCKTCNLGLQAWNRPQTGYSGKALLHISVLLNNVLNGPGYNWGFESKTYSYYQRMKECAKVNRLQCWSTTAQIRLLLFQTRTRNSILLLRIQWKWRRNSIISTSTLTCSSYAKRFSLLCSHSVSRYHTRHQSIQRDLFRRSHSSPTSSLNPPSG